MPTMLPALVTVAGLIQTAAAKPPATIDDLRREFANPGVDYRILMLLRTNDEVDPEQLRWQIHSMREQGCGGVFSYCERFTGGAPQKFLSDWWWQVVRWTAEACAKEGLQYWAYDEEDWPSGSVGGQLVEKHPELGWKYLQPAEHSYDGPTTAEVDIGAGELVGALAFQGDGKAIREDSIVDLTARVAGRRLAWEVPAGRWTVAVYTAVTGRIGWQNRGYPDMMDRRTTEAILDMVYKGHDEQVRRVAGARLCGFFLDEPSISLANYPAGGFTWYPSMPWSPELPEAFRRLHGYEWRRSLPLLYHDAGPEAVRFRIHHWNTCRYLYSENYFGGIYRFCDKHGQVASGHVHVEENFQAHLSLQGGDILAHFRKMHIPGIDWIHPIGENALPAVVPKYAASVAHLLGRNRVWCESFAGCGWGLTFQQMRRIVNWEHVNGINMQIPICCKYSLRGPSRTTFYNPGFGCQQPYWDHFRGFADYEARLCLLAAGLGHVAQIALHYPSVDMQAHCWDEKLLQTRGLEYNALGDRLRAAGYDFDVLDDQAIVDECRVESGNLVSPTESYPVMLFPRMDAVRRETIARCLQLVQSGGTALFVGGVPVHSFESGANDPKLATLIGQLLGSPCTQPGERRRFWVERGRGRAGFAPTSEDVAPMLRDVVTPDVVSTPPTEDLFAYRRRIDDADLYLLYSRSEKPRTVRVTLSAGCSGVSAAGARIPTPAPAGAGTGQTPLAETATRARMRVERWDPVTGLAETLAPSRVTPGGVELELSFAPDELIPIVLQRAAASPGDAKPRSTRVLREIGVPGPFRFRAEDVTKRPQLAWNFSQAADGWKPATRPSAVPETMPAGDWCEHGLATFSGLGRYETEVAIEAVPADAQIVLDLGRVAQSAEVFVNGTSAGLVFFDPYRLDITKHVRAGTNRIEIVVANTLMNYYSQFAELARNTPNLGGIRLDQRASGLLGPVAIRVLRAGD